MKKLVLALAAFIISTQASASVLVEDFSSLADWQTGWLSANSNLTNHYAAIGGNITDRGSNPDGLWLDDNDGIAGIDGSVDIVFNSTFGSSIQLFSLDIASHINGDESLKIDIFDNSWQTIFSSYVPATYGALSAPGIYQNFTVASSNGIGGFTLRSLAATVEGNVSIDNITVFTADEPITVPEPSAFLLLAAGVLGLFLKRRKSQ